MNNFMKIIFTCLLALSIATSLTADTLRVPDEFETIQDALDDAGNRDVVLLADGNYHGEDNVDLVIDGTYTVMSENGPQTCIINGTSDDDIHGIRLTDGATIIGLTITNCTDNAIRITNTRGFTIRNCIITRNIMEDDTTGAGIYATGSSGNIEMCYFTQNSSSACGAGLFAANSDIEIDNCIFTRNESARHGGAAYIIAGSDCEFTHCIFNDNRSDRDGGAMAVRFNADPEITFCNFLNNRVRDSGGAFYNSGSGSDPRVLNSIFWGNEAGEIGQELYAEDDGGDINIDFCIVEGGSGDGGDHWNGQGIIDENPSFVAGRQPQWGSGAYFLHPDSPAVNTGSDDADDLGMDEYTTQTTFEPDEGRVDIGYHYELIQFPPLATIWGYVRRTSDQRPIAGATVITSLGQSGMSDGAGIWGIEEVWAEREFSITATAEGYNEHTIEEITIEEEEVRQIDFELPVPIFGVSENEIRMLIYREEESITHDITISNEGDGFLEWTFSKRPRGVVAEEWDMRQSIRASESVDDTRLQGAIFTGDYFYIAGADNDAHTIYVLNREGALVDTFPQVCSPDSINRYGYKDMAWDGEWIWGSGERTIFAMTTEGDSITSFEGPHNPNSSIAWDEDRGLLWIGSTSRDIMGYDRDGNYVREVDRYSLRPSAIAYWPDDPDGYCLYVYGRYREFEEGVCKIDIENDDFMFVRGLEPEEPGRASGATITNEYDLYSWVFISLNNVTGCDLLEIYQLAPNLTFVQINQEEGFLNAEDSEMLTFTVYPQSFPSDTVTCDLVFSHNTVARETVLSFTGILSDDAVDDAKQLQVREFGISGISPNPFNSTATVSYNLPVNTDLTAGLYDITGREIMTLLQHQHQSAGSHQIVLDGSGLPAGLYLFRLKADGYTSVRKVVLVK